MTRIALAFVLAALATAAQAQNFATVAPGDAAWWLRTSFNPTGTEVRGIPVGKIKSDWCKATEFTRALMPKKEMEAEESGKVMDEAKLSFSLQGKFDQSKTEQIALTGVYQTCAGVKGSFLLIIDADTKKVRFVDATPNEEQFAILQLSRKGGIAMWTCMECDGYSILRWNAKKKAFAWAE